MKIEKLSETQIQVTLNHADLTDRNLKISELAYGSKKAQALFKDMMAKAYEDFGFETDNVPLMIEAVPLSADSIMIVVTKVEDPSQIEQKLEAIGERPTHRTFKEPEEDRLADLALMGAEPIETSKTAHKEKVTSIMYLFNDFDNVCMAAHRVQPMFIGDNSLYKFNQKYYLILNKNKKANVQGEAISGLLDEFGSKFPVSEFNEAFLKEHGKVIIRTHAIDVLAKYL